MTRPRRSHASTCVTVLPRAPQGLPWAEVAAKRRALRAVRDAFVLRRNSSLARCAYHDKPQTAAVIDLALTSHPADLALLRRPSAAEFILDEACDAAKAFNAWAPLTPPRPKSPQCFLSVESWERKAIRVALRKAADKSGQLVALDRVPSAYTDTDTN